MIFNTIFTTLLLLLTTTTSPILLISAQVDTCNKTITTVENFDIVSYTSAPWYIHQQAQNAYTPIERNYCTKAEYTLKDNPTFPWGYTVGVYNSAEYESGAIVEGNLCAYQTEESDSKLAVAPCWLPKQFAGPYWIIAYNETEGYALISGGQPTTVGENGLCRTGTGINNSGLWIFTRSQIRDETLISKVRSIAEEIGFDTSVLNDVDHSSCDICEDKGFFCDWVISSWWRCFYFGDKCPLTCGFCS